jgi:pyruvate formate-lyase activating enzyme-like uncharacterized protein
LPISCVMCGEGSKMVLLVTGMCSHDCFYCPLSLEKQGKRVTYANEKLVECDEDIVFEARSICARGTGITGGDPLLEMGKTVHYIRLLKKTFGEKHNIHLYTSTPDLKNIRELAKAGLDEIRFHPPVEVWETMDGSEFPVAIREAKRLSIKTGIEVPALPGCERQLLELMKSARKAGARFVNLNELEFSESNWRELKTRSYSIKNDVSSAVAGSEETAHAVMKSAGLGITIHYCSSSFKDATQLRKRILRRARNTVTPIEIITGDGTFVKGVVECESPKALAKHLAKEFDIPPDLIRYDAGKDRVELAVWILEEIYGGIQGQAFIVEEYPTADRLEVERRRL